jgi:hypothetical protein
LRPRALAFFAKRQDHRLGCIMGGEIEPPSDIPGFHSSIVVQQLSTAQMVFVNDEDKRYVKGRILTVSFDDRLTAPTVAKLTYSLRRSVRAIA